MNGPPIESVTDITSNSRLGRALRCSTRAPSRTGSVQARTPGAPSTATRQFGHWPEQHINPRRRWYLKLRENVRVPAAYSAEPIVSPASAVTRLPSNVNVTVWSRSIRSPGCGASRFMRCSPSSPGSPTRRTSFVRVSRSARNHVRQPDRWYHHSRCTPATLRRK